MTGKIPKARVKSDFVRLRAESLGNYLVDTVGQSCGDDELSDIVFVCGDDLKPIKSHKLILRRCSAFFARTVECSVGIKSPYPVIPLIVLKEIPGNDIRDILKFIYKGNVVIEKSRIPSLLKTAEFLEIKHLSEAMADADASFSKKTKSGENGTATGLVKVKNPGPEAKQKVSTDEPDQAQSSAGQEEPSKDRKEDHQSTVQTNGTDSICDNQDSYKKRVVITTTENQFLTKTNGDIPVINSSKESNQENVASGNTSNDLLGSPMDWYFEDSKTPDQTLSPVHSLSQSQPEKCTKSMNLIFEYFDSFKTIKYDDHKNRKRMKDEPEEGELKDEETGPIVIDIADD